MPIEAAYVLSQEDKDSLEPVVELMIRHDPPAGRYASMVTLITIKAIREGINTSPTEVGLMAKGHDGVLRKIEDPATLEALHGHMAECRKDIEPLTAKQRSQLEYCHREYLQRTGCKIAEGNSNASLDAMMRGESVATN